MIKFIEKVTVLDECLFFFSIDYCQYFRFKIFPWRFHIRCRDNVDYSNHSRPTNYPGCLDELTTRI